jgi:tRNA pseudouridine13 synthase
VYKLLPLSSLPKRETLRWLPCDVESALMADVPFEKRRRLEAGERDIGCACTMVDIMSSTPLQRSRGAIKTLYSDFIVRELAYKDGQPVVLKSLTVDPSIAAVPPKPAAEAPANSTIDVEEVQRVFSAAGLSATDVDALSAMCATVNGGASIEPLELSAIDDKEKRTAVHKAVKALLGSRFESYTGDNGKVLIQVAANHQRGGKRRGAGGGGNRRATGWHSSWPEGRPEHLHFTLYKENLDTMSALRNLATKMCISQRRLSISGTKDKRGVTLQRVSCRHLEAEKVAAVNGQSWGRNAVVLAGDFTFETFGLSLGKLEGNQFTIVVRDVDPAAMNESALAQFHSVLAKYGFLNYFGPQRFGTTSISTAEVGKCLLARDYRAAVGLILRSKSEVCLDFGGAVAAYENLERGNERFGDALRLCPHYCYDEKDILAKLAEQPNNFEGAVMCLPRNAAMLYCHAVQSLVWNHMVSRRITEWPRVAVGDLVLDRKVSPPQATPTAAGPADSNDESGLAAETTDNADGRGNDVADDDVATVGVPLHQQALHCVTQEDCDANRYSLADVLLPVPGPDKDLQYPTHPTCNRDAYLALCRELSAPHLMSDAHGLAKFFHFHGTYRPLSVLPQNFELRSVKYQHPQQLLVETDGMKLRGQGLDEHSRAGRPEQPNANNGDAVPDASATQEHHGVICTFGLGPGSYATSLLRELFVFR